MTKNSGYSSGFFKKNDNPHSVYDVFANRHFAKRHCDTDFTKSNVTVNSFSITFENPSRNHIRKLEKFSFRHTSKLLCVKNFENVQVQKFSTEKYQKVSNTQIFDTSIQIFFVIPYMFSSNVFTTACIQTFRNITHTIFCLSKFVFWALYYNVSKLT